MDNRPPFEEPLEVTDSEGAVVITGPNGLSAALTPEAAAATAKRLLQVAEGESSSQIYQKPLG